MTSQTDGWTDKQEAGIALLLFFSACTLFSLARMRIYTHGDINPDTDIKRE